MTKKKQTIKKDSNDCSGCDATCCKYIALPIDKPDTQGDFDDIRWYIAHRNIWVFVEDKEWYVCVDQKCNHLTKDNRCDIYETRPRICRKYKASSCEQNGTGNPFDLEFHRPEEIEEYAAKYLREKRAKARAKKRRTKNR